MVEKYLCRQTTHSKSTLAATLIESVFPSFQPDTKNISGEKNYVFYLLYCLALNNSLHLTNNSMLSTDFLINY